MKGSGKYILGVGFLSAFFLLYVHINISMFTLSYSIGRESSVLTQKQEQYRHLKCEVDQLKAPNRLAEQIEKQSLVLDLPSEIHIIQVPKESSSNLSVLEKTSVHSFGQGVSDFFGRWINIAQAKTESK